MQGDGNCLKQGLWDRTGPVGEGGRQIVGEKKRVLKQGKIGK